MIEYSIPSFDCIYSLLVLGDHVHIVAAVQPTGNMVTMPKYMDCSKQYCAQSTDTPDPLVR